MDAHWHKIYMLHRLMVKDRKGKLTAPEIERLIFMINTYPQEIITEATHLTDEFFK